MTRRRFDWIAFLSDLEYDIRKGGLHGRRKAIRWTLRQALCNAGLHWPIRWSDSAYPGSYDPPEPPEPGFCCHWCGEPFPYGPPIRAATWWRIKPWLTHPIWAWKELR